MYIGMGMNKRISALLILAFIILNSCTEVRAPAGATPTATRLALSTATRTVTLSPTLTSTIALLRSTPTQTPTQTPVPGVVRNCLDIQPVLPEAHTYSGRWILVTYPSLSYSLYDLNTKEILPTEGDFPVSVSLHFYWGTLF